jgi:hypothetical protein
MEARTGGTPRGAGWVLFAATLFLILGIFLLALNLVARLFFLPVYPFWSIIVMVIDGLAIYGLTVYGEHFEGL